MISMPLVVHRQRRGGHLQLSERAGLQAIGLVVGPGAALALQRDPAGRHCRLGVVHRQRVVKGSGGFPVACAAWCRRLVAIRAACGAPTARATTWRAFVLLRFGSFAALIVAPPGPPINAASMWWRRYGGGAATGAISQRVVFFPQSQAQCFVYDASISNWKPLAEGYAFGHMQQARRAHAEKAWSTCTSITTPAT